MVMKISRLFYFVSVHDFLSSTICYELNCCAMLRHSAKIEALHICCVQKARAVPELGCSRWKHKRRLELKRIGSAAVPEQKCDTQASGGI